MTSTSAGRSANEGRAANGMRSEHVGHPTGPGRRHGSSAQGLVDSARSRRRDGFRRPQRTVFTTQMQQDSIGTGYLGGGLGIVSLTLIAYQLCFFLLDRPYPQRDVLSLAGWAVLLVTFIATSIVIRRFGRRLPDWMLAVFFAGLAVSTVLDVVDSWGSAPGAAQPSVSVACGAALASIITFREAREIVAAVSVMGVIQVAVGVSKLPTDQAETTTAMLAIGLTVVPAWFGLAIIRSFRRMVQVELDRALVQSTVSAPRFAVGMLASEELERLDLAAERLLADVADGTLALPLNGERAAHASSLATQLRLHLIEGRRETWLHHAISESEFLGPFVTVHDPQGDAGLLDTAQRDGLLSATWLFLSDTTGPNQRLHIDIGTARPAPADVGRRSGRTLILPITISTTAVPRQRVDPATWEAIEQVGRFVDSSRDGNVHVALECFVENPSDR